MCDICKSKTSRTYSARIHFLEYEPINIKLCFKHDIELFKRGQVSFLRKYANEMQSIIEGSKPLKSNFNNVDVKTIQGVESNITN
jgi:hypothetical protein